MSSSIQTLNYYIQNASRCFYSGFEAAGNHYLEKCVGWLLHWSEENEKSDADLPSVLIEIHRAQSRRDIVWIADLLLYRLMPMIVQFENKKMTIGRSK